MRLRKALRIYHWSLRRFVSVRAIGKVPVSTEWKSFHEFGTENRVEGDSGFMNVSIPLGQ